MVVYLKNDGVVQFYLVYRCVASFVSFSTPQLSRVQLPEPHSQAQSGENDFTGM